VALYPQHTPASWQSVGGLADNRRDKPRGALRAHARNALQKKKHNAPQRHQTRISDGNRAAAAAAASVGIITGISLHCMAWTSL